MQSKLLKTSFILKITNPYKCTKKLNKKFFFKFKFKNYMFHLKNYHNTV